MQNNTDVRVLISDIKGTVNVVLARVESLVKSVDQLTSTAVTKEELELVLRPIDDRIKANERARNVATWVVGMIALGVLSILLSHAIPGFNL